MIATEITSVKNPVMTLITKAEMSKLRKASYNGTRPIIKLFGGNLTWLVTGYAGGYLYGYADLGMGCVEWGALTTIEELPTLKIGNLFYIERDRWFKDDKSINWLEKDSLVGC